MVEAATTKRVDKDYKSSEISLLEDAGNTEEPTRKGVGGDQGDPVVPDVPSDDNIPLGLSFAILLESLYALADPNIWNRDEDGLIALAQATMAMSDIMKKVQEGRISIARERKEAIINMKFKALKDAAELIEKALKKEDAGDWWNVKSVMTGLGAVFTMMIGLIVGAACPLAGALIFASGVMQLLMLTDNVVQHYTDKGLGGHFATEVLKVGNEEAMKWDLAIRITMAVVALACAIACFFVTPSDKMTDIQNIVRAVVTIAESLTALGTAVGDSIVAGFRFEAAVMRHEEAYLRADSIEYEAFINMINDLMDIIMDNMQTGLGSYNQSLDEILQALTDKGTTMASIFRKA
jgi:hypothetical protein